jgi:DNA-directed RNA polymerase subunit RPC12/RpoP
MMDLSGDFIACPHCGHSNDTESYRNAPGRYPGAPPKDYYCQECGKNLNPANTQPQAQVSASSTSMPRWAVMALLIAALIGGAVLVVLVF